MREKITLAIRDYKPYENIWVYDADIKGFFDNISHEWILKNIPLRKKILKEWLNAGHQELDTFVEWTAGVPQGGVISPVIANMV